MSHARWLTTTNRILRLYISTDDPWQEFKDLVKFILSVYAPTWFSVKINSSCIDGARNLFSVIQLCKYLKGDQQKVVRRSIQHNAYYAHPENVIMSMLFDKNEFTRERAIQLIENTSPVGNEVRKFVVPKLNFNASIYFNMVNFNELELTTPPMILNLNKDSLKHLYKSEVGKKISGIPCHCQAVERSVKLVTEAASSVTDANRHGFILNKLSSRAKMPKFDSKQNFMTE